MLYRRTLSRQLLFLIPLLVILPNLFKLNGVWASLLSSDFLASLVATIILTVYIHRLKKQSKNNQNLKVINFKNLKMEKKLIINVGRQIGSGGRIIAKMLADEFDCKFYDREILNLAAKGSGFSEKFFEQNDEQKGFMKGHFHIHLPLLGDNDFYKRNFSQESLYQFQSDAIREVAKKNPRCVFVGRTADYVLRDNPYTINIFITASMHMRIANISERRGCSKEEARKFIENGESERAKYYNYYTAKTWGAADSYDLCINTSILGLEQTKDLIADFIRRKRSI